MTAHEHAWLHRCDTTFYEKDLTSDVVSLDECACYAMRGRITRADTTLEFAVPSPTPGIDTPGSSERIAWLIGRWAYGVALKRRPR
jgi:hypothetical protein